MYPQWWSDKPQQKTEISINTTMTLPENKIIFHAEISKLCGDRITPSASFAGTITLKPKNEMAKPQEWNKDASIDLIYSLFVQEVTSCTTTSCLCKQEQKVSINITRELIGSHTAAWLEKTKQFFFNPLEKEDIELPSENHFTELEINGISHAQGMFFHLLANLPNSTMAEAAEQEETGQGETSSGNMPLIP
jgi:hypothetical protein